MNALEVIRARGYSPRVEEALELVTLCLAAALFPLLMTYALVVTLHRADLRLARSIRRLVLNR